MKRLALAQSRSSMTQTDTDTSGSDRSATETAKCQLRLPLSPAAGPTSPVGSDAEGETRMTMMTTPPLHELRQLSTPETIERMREGVLAASTHSTQSVRREALRAHMGSDVRRQLRHVRRLQLAETPRDVSLYQCNKTRTCTTRVLAVTQLHAPIHEIVSLLSHRSLLSGALLCPGLAHADTLHTLVDEPTRYVAVKSLTMHRQWNAPHHTHARNFVVMESHEAFSTEDGRRGWAVSFHSLAWPGCPLPPRGTVRGSVYNTGMVALERTRKSELMDMYSVAEFKLKGQASGRADWQAAKDTVLDTLALLTATVEQRAISDLKLIATDAFHTIERHTALSACSLCCGGVGRVPLKKQTFRCRKCCRSVCGDCSTAWRRGAMDIRLCVECWGDAALEF
jgi:hypothetical protein